MLQCQAIWLEILSNAGGTCLGIGVWQGIGDTPKDKYLKIERQGINSTGITGMPK